MFALTILLKATRERLRREHVKFKTELNRSWKQRKASSFLLIHRLIKHIIKRFLCCDLWGNISWCEYVFDNVNTCSTFSNEKRELKFRAKEWKAIFSLHYLKEHLNFEIYCISIYHGKQSSKYCELTLPTLNDYKKWKIA